MTNYIVLVKQVPDISQITDNAFNPETGTLIRSRLSSVINDLDSQAMAFADQMRKDSKDSSGKIVALTMGPPMAEEVLRYSLARCADEVVLLSDRKLGGADTCATANPLAFAIRRIAKEFFKNSSDYFVISGMQSVDGDTAQVPPQIAEELKLPCITYATSADYKDGQFEFTRIISGGSQIVRVKNKPAVVTVANYDYPLFATFAAYRKANLARITQWCSDDIEATATGVQGSKTRVIRVFPPGKSSRKCCQLQSVDLLSKEILQSFDGSEAPANGNGRSQVRQYVLPKRRKDKLDRSFEGTEKEVKDYRLLADILQRLGIEDVSDVDDQAKEKILEAAGKNFHKKALDDMLTSLSLTEPSYEGEVWVVAEHQDNQIQPATFELIGKSRELADSLETTVGVCLAGRNIRHFTDDLIAAGADNVYTIEHDLLEMFDPAAYRKVVADAVRKYSPQIVLFGATPQGRMLAPMVSYRVQCGLTADCTGLDIRDSSRKGQIGILLQTRPALGGNIMATICTKDSKTQMATARPGVMERMTPDESRNGTVISHQPDLSKEDISLEIIDTEMGTSLANMDADIIISGGKGMQSRDNFEKLVGSLCAAVGDKFDAKVERGASRAAVEQGFVDRVHQVGQTGTAVGPKLYIALGISGAIQHMIGVSNADTIVAINNDPNAPIFKQCDYYMVGSVEETVPQLVEALEVD